MSKILDAEQVALASAVLPGQWVAAAPGPEPSGAPPFHPEETAPAEQTFEDLLSGIEAAQARGEVDLAVSLYRRWLAGPGRHSPQAFAIWFNLATELSRRNDAAGAIAAYGEALALRPDFYAAAVNLGLLFEQHGRIDSALEVWRRALQPDEARTTLLNHRGRAAEQVGRLDEAEAAFRTSLLTDPKQPDVVQHWLHVRQKTCAWPVAADLIPGLGTDELMQQCGSLSVLALTDDVALQSAVEAAWIERKLPPAPCRLSPKDGYRHDKVRLGYLSSDFCSHAMTYLITELLERHDRRVFETYGFCSSPEDGSEIRKRVMRAFDHFLPVRSLNEEEIARTIRAQEIDILIDLNGLTAGTRIGALRWKPAPVQITYLGFIGPVPLPELDYLLCDEFTVPPEAAPLYRPAPLYIAGNYQANDTRRVIGADVTRKEAGLPTEAFVFCSFSRHYKITQEMFAAWMSILSRTPGSVLWLAEDSDRSRDNLKAHAVAAGIDPGRLIFADRVDPSRYIARLALADLFLDTFPYNTGTVASDAIRMELPLLTLAGRAFASRMAGSLLNSIGATEGITYNLSDYVDAAVRLATDRAAYARFKTRFTGGAWRKSIGDAEAFARRYEVALRSVVRRPAERGGMA